MNPKKLNDAAVQHGRDGNVKPCFSVSGAKADNKNILFLGVHGDVTKLFLDDSDAQTVMDVLEDLLDVSFKSETRREDSYRRQHRNYGG